jgi:hypothetical protein
MLEQLYTIWFQLFGSKWLKVGALIKQATPPLLELLIWGFAGRQTSNLRPACWAVPRQAAGRVDSRMET